MNKIETLLSEFYTFMRENTFVVSDETTSWTAIYTPFLDQYNDAIEIYVKTEKGKVFLSDDGNTLHNLELSGISLTASEKRREMLSMILRNHGVTLSKDKELVVEGDLKDFSQKKLNLLSAISDANDLYVLSKPVVASIFKEDVQKYLDELDIIYTPHFISRGSTGLEFTFDFQIAYQNIEIVIKAFNSVNKMNLPQFLFAWDDIRMERERVSGKKLSGMAIINNEDRAVKSEYTDALLAKETDYILWTERNAIGSIRKLKALGA